VWRDYLKPAFVYKKTEQFCGVVMTQPNQLAGFSTGKKKWFGFVMIRKCNANLHQVHGLDSIVAEAINVRYRRQNG
jgi:hypothetical protein